MKHLKQHVKTTIKGESSFECYKFRYNNANDEFLSLTYDALELHVQCVHYQVMIRLQVHITSKGLEGVSLSETSMNYATSCTIGQN